MLKPLGNQAIIFAHAGSRAMRTEIVLASVELDERLAAGLVLAILR